MTEEIYSIIKKDSNLQAKLMLGLNKSYSTIYRWAVSKSERLTTLKAHEIIKTHLKELELQKIKEDTELVK
jgi:hypothetical protein